MIMVLKLFVALLFLAFGMIIAIPSIKLYKMFDKLWEFILLAFADIISFLLIGRAIWLIIFECNC